MNDIFRELKRDVDFDFGDNDAYTVVSQMLVEWCETRGRRFSDLIIKIKVGDYEDVVFESFDSNNYCFVSDYDWWEGEDTIQIIDIKRLEDVFDDECSGVSTKITEKDISNIKVTWKTLSYPEMKCKLMELYGNKDMSFIDMVSALYWSYIETKQTQKEQADDDKYNKAKLLLKMAVEQMAGVGEVCDCLCSKYCPLNECGKFTFNDQIMELIKE